MDDLRYPSRIFFSEEDEGYIAVAPDLSGCSAFGETPEEAIKELQSAIKAWIAAAKNAGNPVPAPTIEKSVDNLPSGKVLARLPRSLHAQLNERAQKDGTSLNTCLVMLLAEAINRTPAATYMEMAMSQHTDIKPCTFVQFSTAASQPIFGYQEAGSLRLSPYPLHPVKSVRLINLHSTSSEVVSRGSLDITSMQANEPAIWIED